MLAWGVYLTLGVAGAALGWAWLAPRLPRRVRLVLLGLLAVLAVSALIVSAQVPHDYRATDLPEFGRATMAVVAELLLAVVGGTAGLVMVGRRRTQNAAICATGIYLASVGLTLDVILDGQPSLQAPTLLLVGATLAVAAGARLAGAPRWLARGCGLVSGPLVALTGEALRGTGNPGAGPATAPSDVLLLVGIAGVLLLAGSARFWRAQGRVLVGPLGWAATGLVGTGLVLVLRGRGEWAPGPAAASTTLYGLPLTVLLLAVSLAILDRPGMAARAREAPTAGARRLPSRAAARWPGRRRAQAQRVAVVLLGVCVLTAVWHPTVDACAGAPDARVVGAAPAAGFAGAPGAIPPRAAPGVAAFDQACTHRTPGVDQLVYALFTACKWPNVDPTYPLVQASGTLQQIDLSNEDSPWIHTSHDLELALAVDPAAAWLLLAGGPPGGLLHTETEVGRFPLAYRPVAGDRVTLAGRWVFDCGHDPKTEIHPLALVAGEHDEWRADAARGPQGVRVVRIWLNSASGVVPVPLAPFDLRLSFPTPLAAGAMPRVQVVAGTPAAVQWTIVDGAAGVKQAAVRLTPPAPNGAAYFELLLGYDAAAVVLAPPPTYTVVFDRLVVRDDLRGAARNTTGAPDLGYPSIGLPGTGHWFMAAMVDHAWRALLTNASVVSGHPVALGAVPPVRVAAAANTHLTLAITGYAENDPSAGVELASGRVTGASVLRADAGRLAALCCGTPQSFAPDHGAWAVEYHVQQSAP